MSDASFLGSSSRPFPPLEIDVPMNSDYHPVLDQEAVRSRFLGESASALLSFARTPLPLQQMISRTERPGQYPPRSER